MKKNLLSRCGRSGLALPTRTSFAPQVASVYLCLHIYIYMCVWVQVIYLSREGVSVCVCVCGGSISSFQGQTETHSRLTFNLENCSEYSVVRFHYCQLFRSMSHDPTWIWSGNPPEPPLLANPPYTDTLRGGQSENKEIYCQSPISNLIHQLN